MEIMKYHIRRLQHAYENYLAIMSPNASVKSIKTKSDDGFCLFRWFDPEEAFAMIISLDRPEVQAGVIKRLVDGQLLLRKNPMKDAKGYVRSSLKVRQFLLLVDEIDSARIRRPRQISTDN